MVSALLLLKITSIMSAGCSIGAALMSFHVGQTEPNLDAYMTTSLSSTSFPSETQATKVVLKYRGVEYQRSLH